MTRVGSGDHQGTHQRDEQAACPAFVGTADYPSGLIIGLDVGSTTVKAVVLDPVSHAILWHDYVRHETRQAETCLAFFKTIGAHFPDVPTHAFRVFATGSGARTIADRVGALFVQEVNAVAHAVERLHPDVGSVIELGGQDAKIIVFERDARTGRLRKTPSMNDKCAGGTGAVIDKIRAKLNLSADSLRTLPYTGVKLHPVAGKCGVFAETDITGLLKQGVAAEELMASLFEALVQQNLSVLARGHTLRPKVLLLGGPNYFLQGLQACWRHNLALLWAEREVSLPDGADAASLVAVPEQAHYFPAIGAALFGQSRVAEQPDVGVYLGYQALADYLERGRSMEKRARGGRGLIESRQEQMRFMERYRPEPWTPPAIRSRIVEGYIGLDGGSTSTKAVLIDRKKRVLAKAYQLSNGNPIQDAQAMFAALRRQVEEQGAELRVLGVATTGYAKDILKDAFGADAALVETVAHTRSGLHHVPNADVICDVGGQDIKVIILKNGAVKDFRLNTQCSAGNGYYLQSAAADFGYDVTDYADVAFTARAMPDFGYGCAVFMQSDIVDFQRQGWQPNEIMAGLAAVLPKNIWLYVCQIPHLARLGTTFVLQGGTQRNLAAVKAQVDFIEQRFQGTGITPHVVVHPHCGESGAIGCAFEALRLHAEHGRTTSFIGLDAAAGVTYTTSRGEETRCSFCRNRCVRTFIDVADSRSEEARRLIVSTCEKGSVEAVDDMRVIKRGLETLRRANPDLSRVAAQSAFRSVVVAPGADPLPIVRWWHAPRTRRAIQQRQTLMARRADVRIGIPRVLNLFGQAPFFMGLFQSLGVPADHIVWSDWTTQKLYRDGAKRGSIDPCFPSKLGIPHVHNLLQHHARRPLDYIFFPMVDSMPTWLADVQSSRACPAATATPEATHAAFVKEHDLFAERGIVYKKTFLNLDWPELCARQFHEDWADVLGMSEDEAVRAVHQGMRALATYVNGLRDQARRLIDTLQREKRVGLVLLGRPYHSDPGVCHALGEAFQKRGYPVIPQDALPIDDAFLAPLFAEHEAGGGPLAIGDVWPNAYLENSSRKIWAAKIVARHPNLIPLEISSFKCGHDAPLYATLEAITERAGKPYFYFRDIDENRPAGSMKIRVETIDYFLQRYREEMLRPGVHEGQLCVPVEAVGLGEPESRRSAAVA